MAGSERREGSARGRRQPALGGLLLARSSATARMLEPGLVLVQVVEQEARLALERDEAGQPLQLAGVEPPVGDRHLEPDDVPAVAGRLQA